MSGHWDHLWNDAFGAYDVWHECVPDGHVLATLAAAREPGLDVELLIRAIGSLEGRDPNEIVETTGGPVSALDYPEEWFETPREHGTAIAAEYARLAVQQREGAGE